MTTRKQTTRGRTGLKKTTGVEWIGGTVAMPAYVTGEGEPYRPEALFWMGADGAIPLPGLPQPSSKKATKAKKDKRKAARKARKKNR